MPAGWSRRRAQATSPARQHAIHRGFRVSLATGTTARNPKARDRGRHVARRPRLIFAVGAFIGAGFGPAFGAMDPGPANWTTRQGKRAALVWCTRAIVWAVDRDRAVRGCRVVAQVERDVANCTAILLACCTIQHFTPSSYAPANRVVNRQFLFFAPSAGRARSCVGFGRSD